MRWLLGAVGVLWAAASVTFVAQAVLPGDRAQHLLNLETGQMISRTPEELAPINARYGFDDPLPVQYLDYLWGVLRGDFGTSYLSKEPVLTLIGDQIASTLVLTVSALVVAWLLMVPFVVATAGRRRSVSSGASVVEVVAAALPQYWLGVILLVVFALQLGWFPVEGGTGLSGLVLPTLTLAIPLAGFLGQVTRDEFERALEQPFVLSARARGTREIVIRFRHVLRHAILPPVTLTGWMLGALVSGAVIVELVFARPGLGQLIVDATSARDTPLVSGVVLVIALAYVIANAAVDALYSVIDPRIEVR